MRLTFILRFFYLYKFCVFSWVVSFLDLWPFCRKWNVLPLSWCFTTFISCEDQDENYIWIVKVLDKILRVDIFKLRESFYQVNSWNVRLLMLFRVGIAKYKTADKVLMNTLSGLEYETSRLHLNDKRDCNQL